MTLVDGLVYNFVMFIRFIVQQLPQDRLPNSFNRFGDFLV